LLLEKRADYRLTNSFVAIPGSSGLESDGSSPRNDDEKPGEALIDVREASFGWNKDGDKAILNNISLKILPSTLTLLVGPIASGKSTLLKSLLGETYLHSGSIRFGDTDNVAYCDQEAWILNRSIRENIVGFSEYSEEFYSTVIKACQLEEDISHLPDGDLSVVGSQGISLSGGQKQRVVSLSTLFSVAKI
jgi:ATP-binding cassette subfamily C (CFTR/MRP) protein 1